MIYGSIHLEYTTVLNSYVLIKKVSKYVKQKPNIIEKRNRQFYINSWGPHDPTHINKQNNQTEDKQRNWET